MLKNERALLVADIATKIFIASIGNHPDTKDAVVADQCVYIAKRIVAKSEAEE
jgi:hypothetical protein